MIGAPYTSYLVLAFLFGVLVLIGLDFPVGTWTLGSLVIIVPLLVAGWFLCRHRIAAAAR
jgi:L-asparagine permease